MYILTTQTISRRAVYFLSLLTDIVDDPADPPAMLKSGDLFKIVSLNPNRSEIEMTYCLFYVSASLIRVS